MPHKEHTFTKFDDDLNAIRSRILEMCELVNSQYKQSLHALFESDASVARQVIDRDYLVNQLEVEIDALCVTAIARQQPAASDLQSIVTATKIVVQLERIGDEAKKIARIAERLAHQRFLLKQWVAGLRLAAEMVQQDLSDLIDSYTHHNTFMANGLLDSRDLSDEEFNIVFRDLIQRMTADPRSISLSLEILFVAKAIERIDRHIRHLAKLVIVASNRYSEI